VIERAGGAQQVGLVVPVGHRRPSAQRRERHKPRPGPPSRVASACVSRSMAGPSRRRTGARPSRLM
jgi:hypothetical protein